MYRINETIRIPHINRGRFPVGRSVLSLVESGITMQTSFELPWGKLIDDSTLVVFRCIFVCKKCTVHAGNGIVDTCKINRRFLENHM